MRVLRNLNEKGLTLIEILAVIVILAIISSIAIPSIQGVIINQRDKAILSDIVHMLESSKMQVFDDECGDKKCEYNQTDNEINFITSKFDEGTVDFTFGNSPDEIIISVELESDVFKGRKREKYIEFLRLDEDKKFTEEDLMKALNY